MKKFDKSKTTMIRSDGTKVKTVAIRFTAELHDAVDRIAKDSHRSFGGQVLHFVEMGVKSDAG